MRISDWSSDVCSSDLVKEDMTEAEYSTILVRLPELPGIAPQRGFARNYPTGAAVGHLIGYVGAPNAEEYQKAKDPLYIRSAERRVGKECVRTGKSRWSPYP